MSTFWVITLSIYAAPFVLGEAFVLLVAAVAVVMNKINKIYGGL